MKCTKCGAHINDGDMFCGECGAKVESIAEDNIDEQEQIRSSSDENDVFNPYSYGEVNESNDESNSELNNENNNENELEDNDDNISSSGDETSNKLSFSINKNKLKKVILIVVLIVALIAATVGGIKIHNEKILKTPITISLNDYITDKYLNNEEMKSYYQDYEDYEGDEYDGQDDGYYDEETDTYYTYTYRNGILGAALPVYGYDGYGYVEDYELYNVVDWNSFYSDLNGLIAQKKGYENKTYRDFLPGNDFSFEIDKSEDISNGDKITVTIKPESKKYSYGDVTIEISEGVHTYEITSLKKVNVIDPFDYVKICTYGANHHASAGPEVDVDLDEKIEGTEDMSVKSYGEDAIAIYKNDYIVAKINYWVDQSLDTISNGDEVTMFCSSEEYETLINDYDLYIVKTDYTYLINNLGDYITKDFEMSDEDLEKFKKYAYDKAMDSFGGYDSYSNINFSCAYLADLKDKTNESSRVKNILYVVYSYDYTDWADEVTTEYYCVEYRNIIAFDGSVKFEASDYYYDYDYDDSIEELVTDNYYSDSYNFRKL